MVLHLMKIGKDVFNDPFPMLAALIFPRLGRSSIGSENVELLLFLRTVWPVVMKIENKNNKASRLRS